MRLQSALFATSVLVFLVIAGSSDALGGLAGPNYEVHVHDRCVSITIDRPLVSLQCHCPVFCGDLWRLAKNPEPPQGYVLP